MIIACPSCATHHNLPDDHLASDGSIIKCASCGHSWLEVRAIEVIDAPHIELQDITNLPAVPESPDADYEAARIARAVKEAEEARRIARSKRRAKQRGWMTLAACICAPVMFAGIFPDTVVRALPGTITVYDKLGIDINTRGLAFNNITHQYVLASGTRVLAIRGEIINVSGKEKTVPSLRFALYDKNKKEIYNWSLKTVSKRPLRNGEVTTFLTRIASPPKLADDFQIRFAQNTKLGSYAAYESHTDKRPQN